MDAITPRPRATWIAGRAEYGARTRAVRHPYDRTEVATVAVPDEDQVERAVAAATRCANAGTAQQRATALAHTAGELAARSAEVAELITAESGKPLRWAEVEVEQAVSTLRFAAREMERATSEMRCADTAGSLTRLVRRVPRGPVLGLLPAHSPLGAAVHLVAAALAVGVPIVLVPPPDTPLSALLLGELLADAELPAGVLSVLPLDQPEPLVADPRLWAVPSRGDHCTAVVLADWPDLENAARRIAVSATRAAGREPDAVRTVVVDAAVADDFVPLLLGALRAQRTGDPYDTEVSVGPVRDEDSAERISAWLGDAVAGGASVLTGGTREGTTIPPTLLSGADLAERPPAPVLTVATAGSAADAFAAAAGTRSGVFTRDLTLAMRASAELPATEVVIGDVPGYRPESLRRTIRDLTEERVTLLPGSPF
ncbi:aldehyde dehydrogenase family protein [Saccharomonospora sp. NPDC046836]|uniref:aldehyde dehydrogenase family protein n=1 Tax=Saccharomonospora sp. NPDC046836 TaxID=3156921 RepID=UPI0033FFD6F6